MGRDGMECTLTASGQRRLGAFFKGLGKSIANRHKHLTIVSKLETGTVEFLAEGRTKASLFSHLAPHTIAEANGIEAIAMDMWSPFFETATEWIPLAADKIVFDRYHVVQHMNAAVNQVRRAEAKERSASGDAALKGTRQLWLYGRQNVGETRAEQFASLQTTNLKTARAWAIPVLRFGLCEHAATVESARDAKRAARVLMADQVSSESPKVNVGRYPSRLGSHVRSKRTAC